ncbi:6-phosphogluconate dehydrogenase, C-terminal [Cynara cardunculus var. scolymus]|uniref:phosphogluconate dehydrogenase (NADP(+)-dependent, decarboxylating) n=1 Tax=Cynara cardunculus var. scolymus TaxID=59895 RepID=A0A118K6T2_CYNCS|nr:6-phosphogluconate dehydrogenase, C-terminal [Cynara cardunculus var. scolymus]
MAARLHNIGTWDLVQENTQLANKRLRIKIKSEKLKDKVALKSIWSRAASKSDQVVNKKKLIDHVRQALYASKICSYAQGMNLIRAKNVEQGWDLKLGELARIWKGGCIIRAIFLYQAGL